MKLDVRFQGDAAKNVIVWVRGFVKTEESVPELLFDLSQIAQSPNGRRPKSLVLASALWMLQEKMGLKLWLSKETALDSDPSGLFLLMESRNFVRLDRPLHLDGWKGELWVQPFKVDEPKHFWLQLDFDKVFER